MVPGVGIDAVRGAVDQGGVRAEDGERGGGERLLDLPQHDLVDRALEPGVSGGQGVADAVVPLVAEHLEADVRASERRADLGIVDRGAVAPPRGPCLLDQPIEHHPQDHLTSEPVPAALVGQGVHRDRPAAVQLAEQVLARDHDVGEVDLAELRVAGRLDQRTDLDPGRRHVDEQVRDPAVAAGVRFGAGEHGAPLGVGGERRPDLVAVDDEVVAAVVAARGDRRQVGAGVGLGEPLAPDVVAGEDPVQVPRLLRVGAVGDDRRADDVDADGPDGGGGAGAGELAVDHELGHGAGAAAAVLAGPVGADEARLVQARLPRPEPADALVERGGDRAGLRQVLGEERAGFLADLSFGVGQGQTHAGPRRGGSNARAGRSSRGTPIRANSS